MPLPTVSSMVVFWTSPVTFRSGRPASRATLTKRTGECPGASGTGFSEDAAAAARPAASATNTPGNGRRSVRRGDALVPDLTQPLEKVGMHGEFPFRFFPPAGLLEGLGQRVVRLRIERIELEGAAEQGDGLPELTTGRDDRSDVVIGVRIGGCEAAGLPELLQGLVVLPLRAIGLAELEVRLAVPRDDLDGALECCHRFVEPQPSSVMLPELDIDPLVLEAAVERRLQDRLRVVRVAIALQRGGVVHHELHVLRVGVEGTGLQIEAFLVPCLLDARLAQEPQRPRRPGGERHGSLQPLGRLLD